MNFRTCTKCQHSVVSPIITKCGHLFCYDCLKSYSQTESDCPKCHSKIKFEESIPIYGHGDQKIQLKSQQNILSEPPIELETQNSNLEVEDVFYPDLLCVQTPHKLNRFDVHPLIPIIALIIIIFHGAFLA
jgi:hypothetical protein